MTSDIDMGAGVFGLEGSGTSRFNGPLDRLLYLRLESQLAGLPAPELTLLAQHSQERRFEAGSHLMEQGTPAPAIHFLVEGRVTMARDGVVYRDMSAPAVTGFPAVLSRDPQGVEVVAQEDCVTLEVPAEVFLDLVEDNFSFQAGGIRGLCGQMVDGQRALERKGLLARDEPREVPYPREQLDLVQRLTVMRKGVYENVNFEPLLKLARGAEEVRLEPGQVLWEAGEPSDFSIQLIYGVVACHDPEDGRRFRMGPGTMLGGLEANAGRARTYRAVTETRMVAMRTPTDSFFDVLEDHPELGMRMMAALGGGVVGLQVRLAKAESGQSR